MEVDLSKKIAVVTGGVIVFGCTHGNGNNEYINGGIPVRALSCVVSNEDGDDGNVENWNRLVEKKEGE
jgi:hypothetical protein